MEIPDILLNPNQDPDIAVIVPSSPWTHFETQFNASLTKDDSPQYDLLFEWDWRDGTEPFIGFTLYATHMFKEGGIRKINVTVTDRDGATSKETVFVNVNWSTQVTILDIGKMTNPGFRHNDTYIDIRVVNISPNSIEPEYPWPKLCDGNGNETGFNGTTDEVPTVLPSGDSFEMTLFFIGQEDFEPFYLVMWSELVVPLG